MLWLWLKLTSPFSVLAPKYQDYVRPIINLLCADNQHPLRETCWRLCLFFLPQFILHSAEEAAE